jgi:hypothetical protein
MLKKITKLLFFHIIPLSHKRIFQPFLNINASTRDLVYRYIQIYTKLRHLFVGQKEYNSAQKTYPHCPII